MQKKNAGVTCVIIGLRNVDSKNKYIISEKFQKIVSNINPYLVSGHNIYVYGRNKPLSTIPEIKFGSMPNDGGHLILSEEEYFNEVKNDSSIKPFIRLMLGGQDFIKGIRRYCIWINQDDLEKINRISFINDRIDKVRKYRLSSKREATKKLAKNPYRFGEVRHMESELIVIPATSSERREYIPMGFLNSGTIVNNSTQAIYSAKPWHLSLVLSKIHLVWVRAISGRLESRIRYSAELSYNTFPIPELNLAQKQELERNVYQILEEREHHPEKTLDQLYDSDKMPQGLREAHHQNDLAVERCYRSKPFESDEERLEYLFKLYEKMVAEEKEKNGEMNFDPIKSKRKRVDNG